MKKRAARQEPTIGGLSEKNSDNKKLVLFFAAMKNDTQLTPIFVPTGQGKTLHALGEIVRVLLNGAHTGGKFSM